MRSQTVRKRGVYQAAALASVMRGISAAFPGVPFVAERQKILDRLGQLVTHCPASRVRLGRGLLTGPSEVVHRLLAPDRGD